MCSGMSFALVQISVESFPKNVVNQRTLPRAADPRHADEILQRKRDVEIAQVVVLRSDDFERLFALWPPLGRNRNHQVAGEVFPGEALGLSAEIVDGSLCHDLTTAHSRSR